MDILVTLTSIGVDQGTLFDLYSNVDGFITPFETNISDVNLLAGYTTSLAPDGTTRIRITNQSDKCSNYLEIAPSYTTTTTTTVAIVWESGSVSSANILSSTCGEGFVTDIPVWLNPITPGTISVGDILYTDALGTIPFYGTGNFYSIDYPGFGITASARIETFGEITGIIEICV